MSGDDRRPVRVAAVQATPVFLDRDATVDHVCDLVVRAADAGAQLIVFPEAFVPGYPDFVWRLPAWRDHAWYRRLADNAVAVPGPAVQRLAEAAGRAGAWVVVGVSELSPSGTLYNTLLYLSAEGALVGAHRKLLATGGERTVWGSGDGSTLTVVETSFGRVGGLICWENYMPLARAAIYDRGVDIYLAPTWDTADTWLATLRHIAKEGRVFVIGTNTCLRGSDVPRTIEGAAELYGGDDDWMSRGNAAIAGPDGNFLAGPLIGDTGILYADLDLAELTLARREFDPVGHYARPDVFRLVVDDRPVRPVWFSADSAARGSAGETRAEDHREPASWASSPNSGAST